MLALGGDPTKAIATISGQLGVSKRNAGRIVMTESAFFATEAQKDCFNELGVEEYVIVSALDRHVCETCGELDGKVFKMSEMEAGVTAPPFHPWCRCCTAPHFDDLEGVGERYARDIEAGKRYTVPRDMTYKEWKEQQDAKYGAGAVDKQRQKAYNESADRKQFERYQAVLKDLAPGSLEDFQNLKYGSPEEWKSLKNKYRIVNQYKVDSGDVSPAEILRLDDRVITEKRTQFSSKFKKSGNIAGAYLDGDMSHMFFAHSALSETSNGYRGSSSLVLLKGKRLFSYFPVRKGEGKWRNETWRDTEAKLFEHFADLYEAEPFESITMFSERGMCDSCKGVMEQFRTLHPGVKINVVSNKRVEGDVWKHRRRK